MSEGNFAKPQATNLIELRGLTFFLRRPVAPFKRAFGTARYG